MPNLFRRQQPAGDLPADNRQMGRKLLVVVVPTIGRHDTYPKRRGMTRVPELCAHAIPVAFGGDCVMDVTGGQQLVVSASLDGQPLHAGFRF